MSTTTTLDTLKADIRTEHDALIASARKTLGHARKIGEYLTRVQAELPGQWVKWVADNCPFTHPTAITYIKVATHWNDVSDDERADLTIGEMATRFTKKRTPKAPATASSDGPQVLQATAPGEPLGVAPMVAPVTAPIRPTVTPGIPAARLAELTAKYQVTGDVAGLLRELGVAVQVAQPLRAVA